MSPVSKHAAGDTLSDTILVIDSGVGGLSVCQSILAQQTNLQIIYFADSAYFPYGLLPEETLRARLNVIVKSMLEQYRPKLVVLACNTVSTLVLPELRRMFDIPFVGVVPAIKPAANYTKTNRIGLLATPATVVRPYTEQLIQDHAAACEVIKVGTSELVLEAEKLLNGDQVDLDVLESVLAPFRLHVNQTAIDTVVLGCTHFPLLTEYLSECMPHIKWVDSGDAIANRVTHLLQENNASHDSNHGLAHQLYFSSPIQHKDAFSAGLEHLGFQRFELHYLATL